MGPQDYEDSSLEEQVVEAPDSSVYGTTVGSADDDRQLARAAGAKSWQREHSPFRFNKQAFLITAGTVAGILLVVAAGTWLFGRQDTTSDDRQSKYANQRIDTQTVEGYEKLLDGTASLQVNGQLQVTDGVTLEPSGAPANPQEGQLYYDAETKQPYYYDGDKFVSFAPTSIPNHVSAIDGVTGSIALGGGLEITSGGQLSLSGAVLQLLDSADGTVNWTDITGYPAACASGQAITKLDDNPTCSSFLTTSSANSNYLRLQSVSPGTVQNGNFNISGTGIAGTINATSAFQSNGTPGVTLTCVSGEVLEDQIVRGGIVTGGNCVPVATGGVNSLNSLTGGLTIQGTAGEVAVSDNGTDTITLDLDANVSLLGQSIDSSEIVNGTIVNADLQAGSFTNITGVGVITIGTWNGTAIADAYVDNNITIDATGTVNWQALSNYPAACSAGEAITALADSPTCSAFLTGSAADGAYVQLQGTTPGSAQTGNLNISGTAIAGAFSGDGSGLTSLNASNISSGTLNNARLDSAVSILGQTIALGSETTGNYQLFTTQGDGITITGSAGVGVSPTVAVDGTVCRTSGNCAGNGNGGGATNAGTENYLTKTDSGGNLVDSLIYDDGSGLGVGTALPSYLLDVQGGAGIVAQFSGRVIGADAVNNNELTTLGQVNDLIDGSGAGDGVTSLNSLSGDLTVQGTAGKVTVSDNTTDTITLDLDASVSLLGQTIDSGEIVNGTIVNADLQAGSFTNITGVGVITIGTWNGTSIADAYVDDGITIDATGTVNWQALSNYPAACSVGEAVTALGDSVTCQAFATGGDGGVNTIGTIDSQTKSADGAVIVGTTLYLQTADASNVGLVSAGSQTFAGNKTFNGSVTIASGQSLTIVGGNTGSRPAGTEGQLYYDTDTDKLLVYSNGKWQADRTSVTKTVAPSGAPQHIKDSADYVADGTADEVEINQALSTAAGGKVYLFEGTFTTVDTISIPNDTTLTGAGKGTVIQFGNLAGASKNMITNTTTGGSGSGITIRDLKLDGNKTTNGTDTVTGIYLDGMGSVSTNLPGATINNVAIQNFENNGIHLTSSANNNVSGNTIQSNDDYGIFTNNANHDVITNNTVTNNTLNGIYLSATGREIVSANVIASNGNYGIRIDAGTNNTISDNILRSNTGSTATSSILITGGASTEAHLITGNNITDTAGTGYAIDINDAAVDSVYLSNNTYSGTGASSINDASGGDTIYAGQVNSSGNFMIQPTGTIELLKNTNVTGSLDASGSLTVGNADQFVISNLGVVTSGTWQGSAIADAYVADNLTVSSSGTVDWQALSNYPAACSAGEAITALADSPTCSAFLTGSAADGAYVQLQGTTPGSAQTGNLNISGTAIVGAVVLNDGNGQTTTLQAGDSVGDLTFILPTAAGSQYQCLKYDTAGQLIWDNCDGGSGGGSGVTSLNGLSGGLTIQGNAQIGVSASNPNINLSINADSIGDAQLTFNTGQHLTVTSTPTFASLIITGNTTANRPGSPTEGQLYYDTDTDKLLVYSNGKWQADRSDAVLVAASDSSQADKDAADYVADGNTGAAADGDQVQINAALTAASGKKVVLLAGTYVVDAEISVPNNTTLTGIGNGTVIELADIDSIANMIVNSGNPGMGIVIQNMKLDGRSDLNAAATQHGIHLTNVGSVSSSLTGATVQNVTVTRVLDVGIYLDTGSENNKVINNTVRDTSTGIYLYDSASKNHISGNLVSNSTTGISVAFNSNNNIITDNMIVNSGGATTNNGITIGEADSNRITNNTITDSSATTNNYAIYVVDSDANSNYIAGNDVSGGSVNDAGTGTLYGGQEGAGSGFVIQPASTLTQINSDLEVSGDLTVASQVVADSLSVGSNQFVVSNLGVVTSGTWQGDVIGLAYGGTNNNSYTTNGVVYSNGTALVSTGAGTNGQCLLATTGSAPSWGACTASDLQGTYNASSPATILLSNAKDFTINTNDTATDSSIVFNLSCVTCSASGGRFAVQDAGTDIFTVNPNGDIVIGTASGNLTLVASSGYKPLLSGNARNVKSIRLLAEYPSVALTADLTNNLGVMTSDYDQTNRMNYYNWTTTELTNQDYDIVVQVPLPSDFDGWDGANPLSITTYTTNTTNGTIALEARDSAGSVICNYVSVTPGSTNTWTTNNSACTLSSGTYTAGDYITLRIRLQAPTSGNTRVGNIVLNYKSKF